MWCDPSDVHSMGVVCRFCTQHDVNERGKDARDDNADCVKEA